MSNRFQCDLSSLKHFNHHMGNERVTNQWTWFLQIFLHKHNFCTFSTTGCDQSDRAKMEKRSKFQISGSFCVLSKNTTKEKKQATCFLSKASREISSLPLNQSFLSYWLWLAFQGALKVKTFLKTWKHCWDFSPSTDQGPFPAFVCLCTLLQEGGGGLEGCVGCVGGW